MDFLIANTDTGETLHLPLNPETFHVQHAARMLTFTVETLGGFRIPAGIEPTTVTMRGLLPGVSRRAVGRKTETAPVEIIRTLNLWLGGDGTPHARLHVLITDSPVDFAATLEGFGYDPEGGQGDWRYDLAFVYRRPLVAAPDPGPTAAEPGVAEGAEAFTEAGIAVPDALAAVAAADTSGGPAREAMPAPILYQGSAGDHAIGIALIVYGAETRWEEIIAANPGLFGLDHLLEAAGPVAIPA